MPLPEQAAPAAEPVTPGAPEPEAATTGEPAAPAAEPVPEPAAEPAATAEPAPEPDVVDPPEPLSVDWESANLETLEGVPETVRPVVESLLAHLRGSEVERIRAAVEEQASAELRAARQDADEWRQYALGLTDEDPRRAEALTQAEEYRTRAETAEAEATSAKAELESLRTSLQEMFDEEAKEYSTWFQENYGDEVQTPEGQARMAMVLPLYDIDLPEGDRGIQAHDAYELAKAGGQEAIDALGELLKSGLSSSRALDLVRRGYKEAEAPAKPKPEPRESATFLNDPEPAAPPKKAPAAPPARSRGIDDLISAAVASASKT